MSDFKKKDLIILSLKNSCNVNVFDTFVNTKNMILSCWCAVFILYQLGKPFLDTLVDGLNRLVMAFYEGTVRGKFHPGKVGGNEMDRLHGVMTPREAVFVCESDSECAGFAFRGPKTLVDEPFDTIFYR